MPCSPSEARFPLLAAVLLSLWLAPIPALAHAKGLYKTEAEALKRAKQLGCTGTHQNNGLWMPCAHEATLHQHMRRE